MLSKSQYKAYEKATGLDQLRQYISDKDYNNSLIEHAAAGMNASMIDAGEISMSPARERQIKCAGVILDYLQKNGYDYKVEKDLNDGQIKATINDYRMSVRLLNKDEDANYCGRVSNTDYYVYYSIGRQDQQRGYNVTSEIIVTPEMALKPLKYAIGDNDIKQINADGSETTQSVGLDGVYVTKVGDSMSVPCGDVNVIRTLTANNGWVASVQQVVKPGNIRISKNKSESSKINTEGTLEDRWQAAAENFKSELELDAVDNIAAMVAKGEIESRPSFSDKSLIANTQLEYYKKRLELYKDSNFEETSEEKEKYKNDFLNQAIIKTFGDINNHHINAINVAGYMKQGRMFTNENELIALFRAADENGIKYTIDRTSSGTIDDEYEADSETNEGDEDSNKDNIFNSIYFENRLARYHSESYIGRDGVIYPRNITPGSDEFESLSPFWQNIGKTIHETASKTGVLISSINVDEGGVACLTGTITKGATGKDQESEQVTRYIGQIIEPDEKGLIRTKFASGDNSYRACGYRAYVEPLNSPDDKRTMEERSVLTGYNQELLKQVQYFTRNSFLRKEANIDDTTCLNKIFKSLPYEKLPLDYNERWKEEGKTKKFGDTFIEHCQSVVKYESFQKKGADIKAARNAQKIMNLQERSHNEYLDSGFNDPIDIINEETCLGFFDPIATGNASNQGSTRYLVSDAKVREDGHIERGKAVHCAMFELPEFKNAEYNAPDRNQMTHQNFKTQSSVAKSVGFAQMSLGGWTQDDAFVVSEKFAQDNCIKGKNGEMRPLKVGDKICDMSGNKGVISYIAKPDRTVDYYEHKEINDTMSAKEQHRVASENYKKDWHKRIDELFAGNPTLEVVGAPYSATSRNNGGTARSAIASQETAEKNGLETTLYVNGKSYEGSIGYVPFIITDMPVDVKTKFYSEKGTGGRNMSWQEVSALKGSGAEEFLKSAYVDNDSVMIKTREMLISLGLDLTEDCKLRVGYNPHIVSQAENGEPVFEKRNEYSVRDICENYRSQAGGGKWTVPAKKEFEKTIASNGGFLKIPFELSLPSGEKTPKADDGQYLLPVMAGRYRCGRETVDGKLELTDFTRLYKKIYDNCIDYYSLSTKQTVKPEDAKKMEASRKSAQSTLNELGEKIESRYLTGKNNIFLKGVMRCQLKDSATMVITPDPTLDLDEVRLTATSAAQLGIDVDKVLYGGDNDAYVMISRSPVLSNGGIRDMKLSITEDRSGYKYYDANNPDNVQLGISINPSAFTSFEGDFDGDSVAVYYPRTKKERESLYNALNVQENILNREIGDSGKHELYLQNGLDVATGMYNKPELKERMEKATKLANEAYYMPKSDSERELKIKQAFEQINSTEHEIHEASFGSDVISYKSSKEHIRSIVPHVLSGAKGSLKKLQEGYAPYFGVKVEIAEDGSITKFEDVGETCATKEDRNASKMATAIKTQLTGYPGNALKQFEAFALNKSSETAFAANAVIHPLYQKSMAYKHSSTEEINAAFDLFETIVPNVLEGNLIQKDKDTKQWSVVLNDQKPVKCSPEQWQDEVNAFWQDKNGLDVGKPNPECLKNLSSALTAIDDNGNRIIKGPSFKNKQEMLPGETSLSKLALRDPSLDMLCKLAKKNASLFEGETDKCLASRTARHNMEEREKMDVIPGYKAKFKPLLANDTQAEDSSKFISVEAVAKQLHKENQLSESESYANVDKQVCEPEKSQCSSVSKFNHARNEAKEKFAKSMSTAIKKMQPDETQFKQTAYEVTKVICLAKGNVSRESFETDVQKTFYDNLMKQNEHYKSFAPENRDEYLHNHPDEFKERLACAAAKTEILNKIDATKQILDKTQTAVSKDLDESSLRNIARSVVAIYMQKANPTRDDFATDAQKSFYDKLMQQNAECSNCASDKRDAYIKANKTQFKERMLCSEVKSEMMTAKAVAKIVYDNRAERKDINSLLQTEEQRDFYNKLKAQNDEIKKDSSCVKQYPGDYLETIVFCKERKALEKTEQRMFNQNITNAAKQTQAACQVMNMSDRTADNGFSR